MPEFTVLRHNDVDLIFNGELLADETADDGGRPFWQHIRVFRTERGQYVVEKLGETRVPGKTTLRDVFILNSPTEVRENLKRDEGGRRFLTDLALDVLDVAAERDPAFRAALAERI